LFSFTNIQQYHTALANGQVTCLQAVNYYLQQIDANKHLNAFIEIFADEARAKAEDLDKLLRENKQLLPLHGVVVGIKDVLCYKEHTVTAASNILQNYRAVYTATAVEKLIAAGAIIIGRQNCDEFAMGSSNENSVYGAVKNAADNTRVPGGSSGGSAVAVQAALCMASLGSDTGGSVRQPADFCGIVGLKPTYGRISRYGLIAYASSFDQIGIFANNVTDAAIILANIAGHDDFDSTVSTKEVPAYQHSLKADKPLKIAYFPETLHHEGLDAEIKKGIQHTLDTLKTKGHIVEPVGFELLQYIVPTYYILTTAEASSNLSRFDGVRFGHRAQLTATDDLTELYKKSRSEGFGKEVQRRILLGTFVLSAGYFDAYFTKAQQVRQLLLQKTNAIFQDYDVILSPTVPTPAFKIGEKSDNQIEMFLGDIYTVYANLVGIPGISIPKFTHSNGMPFGIQLMSAQFNELKLLQAAQLLEQTKIVEYNSQQ